MVILVLFLASKISGGQKSKPRMAQIARIKALNETLSRTRQSFARHIRVIRVIRVQKEILSGKLISSCAFWQSDLPTRPIGICRRFLIRATTLTRETTRVDRLRPKPRLKTVC